ncbi:MAG: hypothetical protein A3C53_02025 [Omnitrophica WOR_2 bacterium RIFCSPHIGHO2_02_FULL_68_15]|nr:MAG: hypothetical protein A3C53_02025 [Omnitrophica WOR_2 bacterium RIFCSPHIGHO2_02_FULL_68_15]
MPIGIGIELGPSGLWAVVLEREGQRLALRATHEVACDTANPGALRSALAELRRLLRQTGPIVLGVPSTSAILAAVTPLVAVPQRAGLAVQFELQQLLPFDVADAAWHYRWISANGSSPARSGLRALGSGLWARGKSVLGLEPSFPQPRAPSPGGSSRAVVAAMRRSLLDERLACCRQAGLVVKAVVVNPIATLNAWDAQWAQSDPAPGAGPSTRTTPPWRGGLVSRLRSGFRASEASRGTQDSAPPRLGGVGLHGTTLLLLHDERSAEWVVRTPSSLQAVPVTGESAERLGEELAASWESLRTQPEPAPIPVWVAGTSELIARLREAAASAALPLEPFELSRVVDTGTARPPAAGHALTAVGLALQALDAAPVALNLLAGFQREARGRLVSRTAAAVSVLLLLAAFGFGLSGMIESRARRTQLLQVLERREKLYQTLRPEIRTRLQRQQRIERYCAQLEHLASDASLVTRLLGQLAATLPESVWLTSLECSKNGLLSGLLEGRATSFQGVTQFFDRLKTVAGMTTVKPLSTSVKTDEAMGKEVIAFSVQIQRPLAALGEPQEEQQKP